MPVADIAGILQASGADTVTEQAPAAGGMCSYLHAPRPGEYRTQLLIDFTRMPSAAQAQASRTMRRQDSADRGMSVTDLGDEAFVAGAEGSEGLKPRMGRYAAR